MAWKVLWVSELGKTLQYSVYGLPSSNLCRRWLFIIEGAVTIVVAFIALWVLPNFPRTTPWLSEEEKQLAVWRLEEDIGEDDWVDSEQQSLLQGAKLAFVDPKTWILVCDGYEAHRLKALLLRRATLLITYSY